jgi:DNA-binding GntR family transcriptional regulator
MEQRPVGVQVGPGSSTSKADHAYRVVRDSVVNGDYEPGSRLVIEHIAKVIGTSVVPVREAIRRLEAEGFVVYTRNVGATVATIDMDRYPETVDAVAILEGAATGLAAPHVTRRDLKHARSLNATLRRSLKAINPVAFSETNHQFHATLYRRCPNRHVLDLLQKEWQLLRRTRVSAFAFIPERAVDSVEEHEHLLDLIEQGRPPAEIEGYVRSHRQLTARALLDQIGTERDATNPRRSLATA